MGIPDFGIACCNHDIGLAALPIIIRHDQRSFCHRQPFLANDIGGAFGQHDGGAVRCCQKNANPSQFSGFSKLLDRAEPTPLHESGSPVGFDIVSAAKTARRVEVGVNAGMDGDEFLQRAHPAEAEHRPFAPSKWQMGIFSPIVLAMSDILFVSVSHFFHGGAAGAKIVGDKDMRSAMAFHGFPQEFQCGLAIPTLCHKSFQDFAFVVNSPPKVVRHAIADAEAKLSRESNWISALASGKSAAEVFGLVPTVRL